MNVSKWQKVGMEIDATNVDDALEQCGAGWGVVQKEIATVSDTEIDGIPVIGKPVPMLANCRDDTGEVIGVVGDTYKTIQNREAFAFFDELVQHNQAKYTYGGMLPNGHFSAGARVFLSAKMDNMMVGPDECEKVMILTTGHDGSSGVSVQFLVYRLVCSNGMIAIDHDNSSSVSIRHTKNYQDRIHAARLVLGTSQRYFEKMQEVFNLFYQTPFTDTQMKELAVDLYPDTKEGKGQTGRENRRNELFQMFHNGQGHEGILNTKWAALNAVAEVVDHKTGSNTKSGSAVNEFNSVLTGTAARVKNQAYQLLVA
jgi:phage/plasmid-like protein (TIGR03299 family)